MTDLTLDSVTVNTILTPKPNNIGATPMDKLLKEGVKIRVDRSEALINEWQKCCGTEIVKQLIIHWSQWAAILPVKKLAKLRPATIRRLRTLGFDDTGDKLVLRIAVATTDRHVISSDGDFWDPLKSAKKCIGDENAPVCKFLRSELKVRVSTLYCITRPVVTRRSR